MSELIVQNKYDQSTIMGQNQITIDINGKSECLTLQRDWPKQEIATLVTIQLMPAPL